MQMELTASQRSNVSMNFEISDFGYIRQGNVTTQPLTIFCGRNNTGKTWVMYAIYGILHGLSLETPLPGLSGISQTLQQEGSVDFDIINWLDKEFASIQWCLNDAINKRLPDILNTTSDFFEITHFKINLDLDSVKQNVIRSGAKTLGRDKSIHANLLFSLKKSKNDNVLRLEMFNDQVNKTGIPSTNFDVFVSIFIIDLIFGNNAPYRPFLLPSERTGLHLLFKELSIRRTNLLHLSRSNEANLSGLLQNIARYAEPVAHYINWLNQLSVGIDASTEKNQDLLSPLDSIIGGAYRIDKEGNISFLTDASEFPIELHLTSSTVNSLAGLWFYIKHWDQNEKTLMIDEPELNLHPANQRALARLLARLVNKGIRVIISTHSDYLIREINSLIMLSQEHPQRTDLMEKYGYSEAEILKPEQVGAYLFDKNSIQTMEVSQDEGIIATTFDEVINDLNGTSDDIFYTYRHWNKKVEDVA